MFETLFKHPSVLARHREGPAAGERHRFLITKLSSNPRRSFLGTSPVAHHGLKADVFGFAIRPILASVYYEYAARLAVEEEYVEFGARTILGCVIAHELGHLLLGSNSHSGAGIMQSPWGQKQVREALTGTLLFTAEQAKLMQAQVRARMGSQTRNPNEESLGTADQQAPRNLIP